MNKDFILRFIFLVLSSFDFVTCSPYVPGTPGGPWTDEEIAIVREKIIQVIDRASWQGQGEIAKSQLYKNAYNGCTDEPGGCDPDPSSKFKLLKLRRQGRATTAKLIRLAFHDCVRNIDEDGTHFGGCDGCLNWDNMGKRYAMSSKRKLPTDGTYDIPTRGDNNGLQFTVKALEMVYTDASWPANTPTLPMSLRDSGKSRADLWQFAANVALEMEIERANFACDYNIKYQQTAVLEGREQCLIKLHKPISWQYGRADCIPNESEKRTNLPYESTYKETGYNAYGTGKKILETLKEDFGFTAAESISLMAVHSTSPNTINTREVLKYKWAGNYLGNMYYKLLAGAPLYGAATNLGGDLEFRNINAGLFYLNGDENGNPIDGTRWIPHKHPQWKKTALNPDGGPIHFRPTHPGCAYGQHTYSPPTHCIEGFNATGSLMIDHTNPWCEGVSVDDSFVFHGGQQGNHNPCDHLSSTFAFPYEVSFVYNFTINEENYPVTPGGCSPFDKSLDGIWLRPPEEKYLMCARNDYAPEEKSTSQIVMDFALDNELWARTFLETWQKMQANGYDNLADGPKSSWIGYSMLQDAEPRWYVDDGCHTEHQWGKDKKGDDFLGTFQPEDFGAGVRCCSEDGSTCTTIGKCPGGSTHSKAKETCEGKGMRLCTKDELLNEVCCKKGGNCDNHPVWTSTLEPDFEDLQFPLLFTDNTKANPAMNVGNVLQQTFSSLCRDLFTTNAWQSPTANGREKNYTPCPPDLMQDRTNLV